MDNELGLETELSEVGEGWLEELLDRLEVQEGGEQEFSGAETEQERGGYRVGSAARAMGPSRFPAGGSRSQTLWPRPGGQGAGQPFWGGEHGRRRGYGYSPQFTPWQRTLWTQQCLARIAEPGLLQTGIMDEATRRALGIFQMQNQLPSTGHLNGETVAALQAACQAQGTETGPFETEWEAPQAALPTVAPVQIQDNLPAIFFKRDSIEIRQDAAADSVIHLLHLFMQIRNYTGHITLHGFASAEGDPAGNKILSQKRADRVKQLLVEAGFAADKITAIGHGVGNLFPTRELNRVVAIERK